MAESIDMDEELDDEVAARRERGDFIEETEDEDDRITEDLEEEEEEATKTDSEDEEETADNGDEEEEGEVGDEESDPPRIPKARLDEVIAQRESEKQRAEWLQAQLEKLLTSEAEEEVDEVEPYDYETAESEYARFIIEGEAEKASKLRREIDFARQAEYKATMEKLRTEALQAAEAKSKAEVDEDRFNSLVEVYEQEYEFLDSASEGYNSEAVETVNTLMTGYMANGGTKAESLKKAVKQVVKFYTKNKKSESGDRKKAAVEKNVKASKQQPGKASGKRSNENRDINISKISDKEFRELSKREIAELRGDFFGA